MTTQAFHEPQAELPEAVRDRHRAIESLREELEAIDWYDQRIAATADAGLRSILAHNRDEEKEHAAMLIEWLRRGDESFDGMLREFLFSDGPIEGDAGDAPAPDAGEAESLAIGTLKEAKQ